MNSPSTRKLFSQLLAMVLSLILISSVSMAQSYLNELVVPIKLPGGVLPARNVWVELVNNSTGEVFDNNYTDSLGIFKSTYVPVGQSFTIKAIPQDSPNFIDGGRFRTTSIDNVIFSTTAPGYDSLSGKLTLSPLALAPALRHFQLQLTNNGQPLALAGVNVRAQVEKKFDVTRFDTLTNASGVAYIPIHDQEADEWFFDISGNDVSDEQFTLLGTAGTENVLISREVRVTDATIVISLTDGLGGGPFQFPADPDLIGGVFCGWQDGRGNEYESLSTGDSQVTLRVVAGTYRCEAPIEGYGSQSVVLTVVSGQTQTASIPVYTKDSTVKLRLVDSKTGETVSGLTVEAWASTGGYREAGSVVRDEAFADISSGEATVSLLSGNEYEMGLFEIPSGPPSGPMTVRASDGSMYILPREVVRFTPQAGSNNTVEFLLRKATSFISVRAYAADGSPLTRGYADAFVPFEYQGGPAGPDEAPERGREILSSGAEIVNGTATIPVLSDVEYEVTVFGELANENSLPPKIQRVTLKDGETRELEFRFVQPNYSLQVNASISGAQSSDFSSLESVNFFGCGAFNESDQHSFLNTTDGTTSGTLPLFVGNPPRRWSIYCYAVAGFPPNETFYLAEGSFLPSRKTSSGEISLTLEEEDNFFGEEEYVFDAAQDTTLVLPDEEGIVEIPAGAIADSGDARMIVQSGRGFTFSQSDYPLTTYDITFEADGEEVSSTQKPVKIHFQLTLEELAELGVSVEDAKAGSFDTSLNNWKEDATFSYDEDTETLTISATHFSLWGVLVDKSNALKREAPSRLRARKLGKGKKVNRYKISWEGPQSNLDEVYELDVLKVKKRKKKAKLRVSETVNWNSAKTVEVIGNEYRTRFKSGNRYLLRVRIAKGINSEEKRVNVR